jgi:X-X-X-Leu-X-X-Gly heptad repeat protein
MWLRQCKVCLLCSRCGLVKWNAVQLSGGMAQASEGLAQLSVYKAQ